MTTTAEVRSPSGIAATDERSYRAFLTFDARPDAVELALQQVTGWLLEKKYEVPDLRDSGFTRLNERADLVVVHHETKHGHAFRIRLTESGGRGEWHTSIALNAPSRADGWLSIRVGHSGGIPAETPKVARYLLQVLDVRDSGYQIVAGAPVVRPDGVEDLLEAVCDPDRRGLLFVAGTDAANTDLFTPFAAQIERIARRIHGLAQVVILDPAATEQFNAGIGETHAAPPWTIRTYSTNVDPAWAPDARRHRILGTERLANEHERGIAGILLRAARSHAATHELPANARSVLKDLNRVEDRLLLASLYDTKQPEAPTEAPPAPPWQPPVQEEPAEPGTPDNPAEVADRHDIAQMEPVETHPEERGASDPSQMASDDYVADPSEQVSEYLSMFEMVKQTLGIAELTEDALQQVIQEAARATEQARARQDTADRVSKELVERQRRIEELEDQLYEARTTADDALIEQRMAEEARRSAQDEARWLRRQFHQQGRHDEAWIPIPEDHITQVPDCFEDLITRLPELEACGVVFTGDRRITLSLDDQDTLGSIVGVAWECLLVLTDYIAAKKAGDYSGNFMQYVLNTPAGYRPIPKRRFGEKETSSTLDQWAKDRIFPVPTDVREEGEVLMEAHFKLPHCGMVTPRIHFYDHTHASGKVYVGYIGPHLRTKGTN